MKRFFTLICLLCPFVFVWAGDVTFDFSKSIPSGWTASVAPFGYETASRGAQWTANATLTLKGAKNVTAVTVVYSCNIASGNSLKVSVGGTSWGEVDMVKETLTEKQFTGTATDGDIVISITRSSKSVYISKVIVSGEVEGGEEGGDTTPDTGDLDDSYTYDEPTVVSASAGSYPFVQNNIKVTCPSGAVTDEYFSCYAGNSITFTATQNIRAVVVNGLLKKGFEAEVNNGEVTYVDASEEEVEDEPVLIINDIDAPSVTINCEKQMRCYSVEFYFTSDPEVVIDDSGVEDLDYTYEPTAVTALNITFDELQYSDYTSYLGYPCSDLYFVSDEFEMDLLVYTSTEEGTALAPGTYVITDTYEDGTVQASPGGNEDEDYPTYIATDFVYYEEYDVWGYNAAYYIVSGTLTVEEDPSGVKMTLTGTTYNGSTVNATYVGTPINADVEDAIAEVKTTSDNGVRKVVKDGHILIQKAGDLYNLQGMKIQK